jgi:hypothetical protein
VTAAIVLAVGAAVLLLVGGGGSDVQLEPPEPPRAAVPESAAPAPDAPVPLPARNVFEYRATAVGRREPVPPGSGLLARRIEPAEGGSQPHDGPVRLVGLVRRAVDLEVAVSIDGQVVILAPGEQAGGYTLVAVEEDLAVRLAGPEGELVLPLP